MNEVFRTYLYSGYRYLTETEKESMMKAMDWLKGQKIPIEKIVRLSLRNVDLEGKRLLFEWEKGRIIIKRVVKYDGSVFEEYMREVFPQLKSNRFVFVTNAWTGRKPVLCSTIRAEILRSYYEKKRKKKVFELPSIFGIIEVSIANNAH